jgi:hypothetical protein
MAIVQISQITNRKGLQIDLPQLAGAELGWSVDTRQLYIGNGTLAEGAPVIGNTEILTEFSDILQFQTSYTYKGSAAGYVVQTGPTPTSPVVQSLQSWLDQYASVKDFGAVGDGTTDDTAAINRALDQIYCREINPQIRRSLFFPAGVYRVTGTILIPSFATLIGEGADNSVIQLDADLAVDYVARTADSQQQYGANIGNNGAITPQFITVSNLGFASLTDTASLLLVQDAVNCNFNNVTFTGPLTTTNGLDSDSFATSCVEFASTNSIVTSEVTFNGCSFSGTTWAVNTDQQVKGVIISQSKITNHYVGIELGTGTVINGGPTGFRIVQNLFDNIYAEGVLIGDINLNATGYNIFYDVGNHFGGLTTPYTAIVNIQQSNNVSIGDMFERTDQYSSPNNPGTSYARVALNNTQSIATTNGASLQMGTYYQQSGYQAVLLNNTSSPTTISSTDGVPLEINGDLVPAFSVDYTITRQTGSSLGYFRKGLLTVAVNSSSGSDLTWGDDYVENEVTGIILTASQTGSVVSVQYTSTATGFSGSIKYSVNRFV